MKSKNIKDYKVGTRILYSNLRHQTRQCEAIISEFSDSGEYVCLEYASDKTNDWYNVKDIIIFDTLKDKPSKDAEDIIKKEREQFAREEALFQKYDKMSYEQKVADAIDEECRMTEEDYDEIDWNKWMEENSEEKTKPNKNDSFIRTVMRVSDGNVFTINDYNQKFYRHIAEGNKLEHYTFEEVQKFIGQGLFSVLEYSEKSKEETLKEKEEIKKSYSPKYSFYPNPAMGGFTYYLVIMDDTNWSLRMKSTLSVPKLGIGGDSCYNVLGEGKIDEPYMISMYTLSNLKRIVNGLNFLHAKDRASTFETSKEKVNWQKDFPHSITTSNPMPYISSEERTAKNTQHFSINEPFFNNTPWKHSSFPK